MKDEIRDLKGSPKRDLFKWAHKNKIKFPFYAADADLCLITNKPAGVVAYLDYKSTNDSITFTERILYDEWVETKPVYIIYGNDPENGPFIVHEYHTGGFTEIVCALNTWDDFAMWEKDLRANYTEKERQATP